MADRSVARCLIAVGLAVAMTGCSSRSPSVSAHHAGPPTEPEARDAYFNTPLIVDDAARELPLGMTEAAIVAKFEGASAIQYRRGGRRCVIYPIADTERWDAFGSPAASEWEFCFSGARLAAKRRIP
ncbi:MAG: hypothetical protein ACXVRK_12955 [Gaiellaceae bacterium]